MEDLARLQKPHDTDEIPPTSLNHNLPTTGTTYDLYHYYFSKEINFFPQADDCLGVQSDLPPTEETFHIYCHCYQ